MTAINPLYTEWMEEALALADRAERDGDVPVGALVVDVAGNVVGRGWNTREKDQDPLGHAELMAIRAAATEKNCWRLEGMTLVVTLEPCTMCASALVAARLKTVVFGAYDRKAGGTKSLYCIPEDPRLNHRVQIVGGVLEEQCQAKLQTFFQNLRGRSSSSQMER